MIPGEGLSKISSRVSRAVGVGAVALGTFLASESPAAAGGTCVHGPNGEDPRQLEICRAMFDKGPLTQLVLSEKDFDILTDGRTDNVFRISSKTRTWRFLWHNNKGLREGLQYIGKYCGDAFQAEYVDLRHNEANAGFPDPNCRSKLQSLAGSTR